MSDHRRHARTPAALGGIIAAMCVPPAQAQCGTDELRYPGDPGSFAAFGSSVGIWSDVIAVGATRHTEAGIRSGAVFVYRQDPWGQEWAVESVLLADDGRSDDYFGFVGVWGDVIVVGAPWHDGPEPDTGAAYVFRRINGVWVQEQKLLADDREPYDLFGAPVVRDDVIAVAAPWDGDNGSDSGSVYVFRFNGAAWVHEQRIAPEDGGEDDRFGTAMALEDDRLLVGTYRQDFFSGAAYLYRFEPNGARWELEQKFLKPDNPAVGLFGSAVGIHGDRLIIGSMGDGGSGTTWAGAAYLYRYDPDASQWLLEEKLVPSDRSEEDHYGSSVAITGDFVLVGKSPHSSSAIGPPALFHREAEGWKEIGRLDDTFLPYDPNMGTPVRTWGARAVVGSGYDIQEELQGVVNVFNLNACECPADFDGNGLVTTHDVLVFLSAWAARHPGTDFHPDGQLDTRDIVAFLNLWTIGC